MAKNIIGIALLSLVVLIVGGVGLYLAGSPMENRKVRYDEIRVRDLDRIRGAIDIYYQDNYQLPSTVVVLLGNRIKTGTPYLKKEPKDPKNKSSYTFRPLGISQYELCATFETSSEAIAKRKTGIDESLSDYGTYYGDDRSHPVGLYCFTKTVSAYLERQYNSNPVQTVVPPAQTTPIESTNSAF